MHSEATLSITGMTCGSCVQSVETLALKIDGVESAAVNLPMMRGRITLASDAGEDVIQKVIQQLNVVGSVLHNRSPQPTKWQLIGER